jgi:FdrA protein
MSARLVQLRRGAYRDSVRLMQVSQALQAVPGVSAALVAMATELNLELAAGMGFAPPEQAAPNDMLVAVAAADDDTLAEALRRLDGELTDPVRPASGFAGTAPRTVGSAVRGSGANLVLVSTPGRYAFLDAMDALDAGASVMLFSDNVPVSHEVRLKEVAAERGLLVMGPDCGTAVIGGVGLGFANVVRPGPVGLVAASGTGAQQVMCLLDAAGVGVSHCLGVGGRDLSAAVRGRATRAALDALDADEATELILVVSKPPAIDVADLVRAHAASLATPVVFALLGAGAPDLTAAVEEVLGALGQPVLAPWPRWLPDPEPTPIPIPTPTPTPPPTRKPRPGALRGLFAGGTLCDEAMVLASERLGRIWSNIPLRPEWTVPASGGTVPHGHSMVDFGDDRLTAGRPHPMIDGSLRIEALAKESADPSCAAVLLDVVLGYAADPDPAAALAPAIAAARDRGAAVFVSLIGTAGDPQGTLRQATALRDAGAAVFLSNAEATRQAVAAVGGGP